MRQGLRKSKPRITAAEKEVKLKLRKAGLSADGVITCKGRKDKNGIIEDEK